MKVGVIGCGGMGTTHYLSLKALSSQMDVEVVALADCREEFLQKAAAEFPEARTYTYGMELIERENLDAVHICLPSYLHTEHAVAAMKKGMNVLVEKPVCLTREEGELLLETQKETGVKVMVGQVVRAFDEYRYLKEVYANKTLGKLKSIVMQRVSGNVRWGFEGWFHDEKKSGSVVLDLHIHDLDFLRYMLGEPDDFEVRATTFDSGMINQVITTYEFGDVFATAEGVWDVSPTPKFQADFGRILRTEPFTLIRQDSRDLRYTKMTEQRSFRNFIRSMRTDEYRYQHHEPRTILYRDQVFSGMSAGWKRNHSRRFRKA